MALETGTHISDLNAANPVSTDGLAQADDHLRLIKSTILASFPNITGAMTATHTNSTFSMAVCQQSRTASTLVAQRCFSSSPQPPQAGPRTRRTTTRHFVS